MDLFAGASIFKNCGFEMKEKNIMEVILMLLEWKR